MRLSYSEACDLHFSGDIQVDVSIRLHGDGLIEVRREPVLELQCVARPEEIARPLAELRLARICHERGDYDGNKAGNTFTRSHLEPPTHHFAVHPIGYWVCSLVENMTQNFSVRAFDGPFEKGYLAFRRPVRLDHEQDAIRQSRQAEDVCALLERRAIDEHIAISRSEVGQIARAIFEASAPNFAGH